MQHPGQSDAKGLRDIYNRRSDNSDYIRASHLIIRDQSLFPVLYITICTFIKIMSEYLRPGHQTCAIVLRLAVQILQTKVLGSQIYPSLLVPDSRAHHPV